MNDVQLSLEYSGNHQWDGWRIAQIITGAALWQLKAWWALMLQLVINCLAKLKHVFVLLREKEVRNNLFSLWNVLLIKVYFYFLNTRAHKNNGKVSILFNWVFLILPFGKFLQLRISRSPQCLPQWKSLQQLHKSEKQKQKNMVVVDMKQAACKHMVKDVMLSWSARLSIIYTDP